MGRTCEATSPASVKMIEMTEAKIGRSMKNFENTRRALLGRGRDGVVGLRAHRSAGPQLEQVVDHDPVARVESGKHDPARAAPPPGLHRADLGLVLAVEH